MLFLLSKYEYYLSTSTGWCKIYRKQVILTAYLSLYSYLDCCTSCSAWRSCSTFLRSFPLLFVSKQSHELFKQQLPLYQQYWLDSSILNNWHCFHYYYRFALISYFIESNDFTEDLILSANIGLLIVNFGLKKLTISRYSRF